MILAFKIAWRNIWKHKGKSIVIGIIIFFGAFLMSVGNGIISGMEEGLSKNIVNLFTGDIVVMSNEQEKDNVLFDMMSGKPLKVIKDYADAKTALSDQDTITDFLPATAGLVFVLNDNSDMGNFMLLGVDIDRYLEFFPESIKITDGKMLATREKGMLVSELMRETAYNVMDFWVVPQGEKLDENSLTTEARENRANLDIRNDFVIMGASTANSAVDVRVPVRGIFKYRSLNQIWGNYCIIDIESFRQAHNYVTGADSLVEISNEEKDLFASENLDDLFSTDDVFDDSALTEDSITLEDIQADTNRSNRNYNLDAGSYNVIFLKLKEGVNQQRVLKSLNKIFTDNNLKIRAVSWKDAIGSVGSMAVLIKVALNAFIMIIFFVAIIVIMNTLSMTALERISELAMMRAIGARKGFLRQMFVLETGILSFFFGGLGIIAGIIVIYLLRLADITTTNEFLQMVYGGDSLNPVFTSIDLIIGIAELGIVTLLSVLYPLRVLGKIVPLDAVVRE